MGVRSSHSGIRRNLGSSHSIRSVARLRGRMALTLPQSFSTPRQDVLVPDGGL